MSPFTEDEREQRLRHLMEVYGDGLKRLCCVYLRDMGLAEDAVQETFIKAYDHIDELLSGKIESTKAWLMRIAVNTCKDTLRSSWMRHIDNRQEIEALPLSIASCAEERLALTQAIMALAPSGFNWKKGAEFDEKRPDHSRSHRREPLLRPLQRAG